MKRALTTLLLAVTIMLMISTAANAGILDSAKDWVMNNALQAITGLIFMVIGCLWGGKAWAKKLLKSKIPVSVALEVLQIVRNARKDNSDGGKTITKAEYDAIFAKFEVFVKSVITAITGKTP